MVYEDYLRCEAYEGQAAHATEAGFSAFFHEESQRHFFAVLDATGKVLLKSEGYPQPAARENGIQSVIRNRGNADFYSVKSYENGRYYISLRAANHREIARSCSFLTEAEALADMPYVTGAEVRPTVVAAAIAADTTKKRADNKVDDDYLACREYAGQGEADADGIVKFANDNGQYYFAWVDASGDVIMRSEGYPTKAARDNGANSVVKNRDNEDRYSGFEKMGRYFVSLKAGNHQEIARSCPFNSEAESRSVYPSARAGAGHASFVATEASAAESATISAPTHDATAVSAEESSAKSGIVTEAATFSDATVAEAASFAAAATVATAAAASSESTSSESTSSSESHSTETTADATVHAGATVEADVEDDYLPCKEYEGHKINDKANNVAMFKHENGQFYFAIYNADGGVRLRSEGFRTAQDRDKELSGALKNLNNADRYSTLSRGIYSMSVLKDATGREVGRGCLEKAVAAVAAPAPVVEVVEKYTEVAAVAAPLAVAAAVAAFAAAPEAEVVETHVEAAVPVAEVVETHVETAAPVVVEADVEDDYLPCKEYEGHNITDKGNNLSLFKHSNGQFYFVFYNSDGSVRLRSEGFRTVEDRQKELTDALKNLNNQAMYSTIRRGEYSMSVLKDADGREVGRGCLEKDATLVAAPAVAVAAPIVAAAAAVAFTAPEPPAAPVAEADIEDDYMVCKEYAGHKINDKMNNVAMFKHNNGQFYFAIYHTDGSVRLRSEGFKTSQDRDKELSGALKNLNNKDMYTTVRRGEYWLSILKDSTGREVGRSCLQKEQPVVVPPVATKVAAAAAVAAVGAIAAAVPKVEEKKVVVETPKVAAKAIVETPKATIAAQNVVEEVADAAGGGFKWWWLLPILALLGWWLFSKGCNKEAVVVPPTATAVVVDTVKKEVAAPVAAPIATPAAPTGCAACASGTDAIFTSVCDNPKKLNRLGSNPEFGNSHALSASEFYAKLKKAHADNDVDKEFLDRVYKAMGYKNGFADAKADQFSAVVLPIGTSGKLGYSKLHKTGCYTLPDDEYHRKAFHITAANGCDLHFMKTCGNHFFFCNK
jgi:uncharacterized protein YegP (UPF0339 family)